MRNRNYICHQCGKIFRLRDNGLSVSAVRKCCGDLLQPLSHEQAFAATHMEMSERPGWLAKGGHIIKGPSERKRWLPALKVTDIEKAKSQKENHRPKKTENYPTKVVDVYVEIAEPFIKNNLQLLDYLISINEEKHIANVLFMTVPQFRKEIYRHIKNYNLNNQPRKYLEDFIDFLFYLCRVSDGSIIRELSLISRAKGIKPDDFDMIPIRYSLKINRVRDTIAKSSIRINKTLPDNARGKK